MTYELQYVLVATETTSRPNGAASRTYTRSQLRKLAAELVTSSGFPLPRAGFDMRAGSAYGGRRNYDLALGYLQNIAVQDYRDRYDRWGIASRIVDAFPKATWAGGAEIIEDDDPTVETDFERETADLFKQFKLWQRLCRADRLAGIGRFGILLIGAPGSLAAPLPIVESTDDILYFQPYGEDRIESVQFDNEPSSERFGLPVEYRVKLGVGDQLSITSRDHISTETRSVHYTRVIHIADGLLDNDVFGKPRLEAVWNYLDDLVKVVGGGAEAAWRRADPGTKIKIPLTTRDGTPIELGDKELEELEEEIEKFVHGATRVLRLREGDVELMESEVTTFNRNADAIIRLISGTSEIPTRILLGSERGELASSQDRANWNERVVNRRRDLATLVVRDLVDRLIDIEALPTPEDYRVLWPEAAVLDESEKAGLADTYARANQRQSQFALPPILTADEIRHRAFGLEPLDTEDDFLVPPGSAATPPTTSPIPQPDSEDSDSDEDSEED